MSLRTKLFRAAEEGRFVNSSLLWPLSCLWGVAAYCKNGLYDRKLLPIHRLSVPVISVGNLVAGGVGKTPLVHFLAKNLSIPLALLSRGYLAKRGEMGDEMQMLLRRLPSRVQGYCGKDRLTLGKKAVANGAKLVILDDGFQYRCLHRDLDVLVLDASNPFGYGDYLPRGLLRDSPQRISQADVLFVYGERELPLDREAIYVKLSIERIIDCATRLEVPCLPEQIGACCAIARPERFFKTLSTQKIVDRWTLADHAPFSMKKLEEFALHCRRLGASALVCTEKDAVKLEMSVDFPLPVLYLEMGMEITSGAAHWDQIRSVLN